MQKLTYEKWQSQGREEVRSITFSRNDDKRFEISFQGNLDLYFSFISLNDNEEDFSFLIGKDCYQVWEIFDKLYKDIINCNVFELTEDEIDRIIFWSEVDDSNYHEKLKFEEEHYREMNEDLKSRDAYKSLVKDGVITWRSDDYCFDIAPFFKIKIVGESYLITFGIPEVTRKLSSEERWLVNDWKYMKMLSVRLRNSGSRYIPFNMLFMTFFNSLMDIMPDYHQIHIEEYLIDKELEKGESLERILRRKN